MYVRHLSLADFRSYPVAEVGLGPGVTTLVGLNGQGKTNLVEAIGYLATLSSHRVSQDAPLIRAGAERAIVRGAVVRDGRESLIELEIIPGKSNRARLNRSPVQRPREVLGTLRSVLFAPEDLALVKGDPSVRRSFLDDLLVQRQPRWAGVRSDYDKILKQRAALLKSAGPQLRRDRRRRSGAYRGGSPQDSPRPAQAYPHGDPQAVDSGDDVGSALHTLSVWDEQLTGLGAQLLYARLRLARDLNPLLGEAYDAVSGSLAGARLVYRGSGTEAMAAAIARGDVPEPEQLRLDLLARIEEVRADELDRGVNLVGPHRDDLQLQLGDLPAKGYASHGESWSFALGLKLASFRLLRNDLREDPVLILDDVFAELDARRRERLAELVADAEQVLVTAAVAEDIPAGLRGARIAVTLGSAEPEDTSTPADEAASVGVTESVAGPESVDETQPSGEAEPVSEAEPGDEAPA